MRRSFGKQAVAPVGSIGGTGLLAILQLGGEVAHALRLQGVRLRLTRWPSTYLLTRLS